MEHVALRVAVERPRASRTSTRSSDAGCELPGCRPCAVRVVLAAPRPRRHRRRIGPDPRSPRSGVTLGLAQSAIGRAAAVDPRQPRVDQRFADVAAVDRHSADDAVVLIEPTRFDRHVVPEDELRREIFRLGPTRLADFRAVDVGQSHAQRRFRRPDRDRVAVVHGDHVPRQQLLCGDRRMCAQKDDKPEDAAHHATTRTIRSAPTPRPIRRERSRAAGRRDAAGCEDAIATPHRR